MNLVFLSNIMWASRAALVEWMLVAFFWVLASQIARRTFAVNQAADKDYKEHLEIRGYSESWLLCG